MHLRGIIRDGEGEEAGLPSPIRSLICHSLAAGDHLSSVASGSLHGFSSSLLLGPEVTPNTIRRSGRVSGFRATCKLGGSKYRDHSDGSCRLLFYTGVRNYVGTVS